MRVCVRYVYIRLRAFRIFGKKTRLSVCRPVGGSDVVPTSHKFQLTRPILDAIFVFVVEFRTAPKSNDLS